MQRAITSESRVSSVGSNTGAPPTLFKSGTNAFAGATHGSNAVVKPDCGNWNNSPKFGARKDVPNEPLNKRESVGLHPPETV